MAKRVVISGVSQGLVSPVIQVFYAEGHPSYSGASADTQRNDTGQTGTEYTNRSSVYHFDSVVAPLAVELTGPCEIHIVGESGAFYADFDGAGTADDPIRATYAPVNVLSISDVVVDEIQNGLATPTNITAGTITTATNVTTVNGLAANTITATAIASDAITDAKVASDVTIASVTGAVGSVTGNVGGNVTGSVGSLAAQAKADVNAEAGAALLDVGLTTTITGRIDAAVSSRASQSSITTLSSDIIAAINALNQSASRRVTLAVSEPFERPESGASTYTIQGRTYTADGAAVDADSPPTLTATGIVSGSLAANLSAATNPATGVYQWVYTVASNAALEQIKFDLSAAIAADTFTMTNFSQTADFVAATFTTTDRATLDAILADTDSLDTTKITTARANKIDEITAARMGVLTDWIDGGRLDLILDARASQNSLDLAALSAANAASQSSAANATVGHATYGNAALATLIGAIPTTIRLKKNTALANFMFILLDTAGDPATGKTVTGTVSIDGAAFASLTNAVSEIGSGAYKVNLAAADVNGDVVLLKFSATDCETVFVESVMQP